MLFFKKFSFFNRELRFIFCAWAAGAGALRLGLFDLE